MQAEDNKRRPDKNLVDKINELEKLIHRKNSPPNPDAPKIDAATSGNPVSSQAGIPVLDDLITSSDYAGDTGEDSLSPHTSDEKLEQLIERVQNKLAGELERLVTELKGNMKASIKNEVRSQLNQTAQNKASNQDSPGKDSNDQHRRY